MAKQDITDEEVQSIIAEYAPDDVDEILAAFYQFKEQIGMSNLETLMMVQKLIKEDEVNESRFGGLRGRFQ